jgi:hypothetical protein
VTPAASTQLHLGSERQSAVQDTGGATTTYRYDVRDKLIEALQGTSISGRFVYDFSGRRSQKIGADGIVQYTYDQTSRPDRVGRDGRPEGEVRLRVGPPAVTGPRGRGVGASTRWMDCARSRT